MAGPDDTDAAAPTVFPGDAPRGLDRFFVPAFADPAVFPEARLPPVGHSMANQDAFDLALAALDKAEAAREAQPTGDLKIPSFWTAPRGGFYEPKFQYRFKVVIPGMGLEDGRIGGPKDAFHDRQDGQGGFVWYAKSVDKPGYSVEDIQKDHYYSSNNKASPLLTVDRILYKPVSMTLIDPGYPNATRKLVRFLRRSGFHDAKAQTAAEKYGPGSTMAYLKSIGESGPPSTPASLYPNNVFIHQLDASGAIIETFILVEGYPAEVDFGKLDYSSNDPVEITVKWLYKSFIANYPKGPGLGNEKEFVYLEDHHGTPDTAEQAAAGSAKCRAAAALAWLNLTPGQRLANGNKIDAYVEAYPCS
jgi:hypothetical protein